MITFNFFEDSASELIEKFCAYYRLDKEMVIDYFITVDPDTLTPEVLVEKFDLKLNTYDSRELGIVCRHMTTSESNDLKSFMSKGLLDLRTMLQEKTALSLFLENHKIKVFVDERKLEIEGKIYPILESQEQCKECYNGQEHICNGFSRCKTFEKISYLATKLYCYGATIECFIYATLDEMKRYSMIDKCPEILNTLDGIYSAVNGQFSTTYTLSFDWMKKNKNCYVLEYVSKWSDMETFAPFDYRRAYQEYERVLYSCGYEYSDYMEKTIPKSVYDNIIFLKRFIEIYFYGSEKYGSLLPGGKVPPEALTIYKVVDEDMEKVV